MRPASVAGKAMHGQVLIRQLALSDSMAVHASHSGAKQHATEVWCWRGDPPTESVYQSGWHLADGITTDHARSGLAPWRKVGRDASRRPYCVYGVGAVGPGQISYLVTLRERIEAAPLASWQPEVHLRFVHTVLRGTLSAVRRLHQDGLMHGGLDIDALRLHSNGDIPRVLVLGWLWPGAATGRELIRRCQRAAARAAPEQIWGRHVGPWTDVYAVGLLLHQLLTLRTPFAGDGCHALMRLKTRATANVLDRLGRDIAAPLRTALAAMLATDPAARPRDVRQAERLLSDALQETIAALPSPMLTLPMGSVARRPAVPDNVIQLLPAPETRAPAASRPARRARVQLRLPEPPTPLAFKHRLANWGWSHPVLVAVAAVAASIVVAPLLTIAMGFAAQLHRHQKQSKPIARPTTALPSRPLSDGSPNRRHVRATPEAGEARPTQGGR